MTDLAELDRLSKETPREALPDLLGAVVAAEARIRLRLAEPAGVQGSTSRALDPDQAATIASTSKRWLLAHTRGQRFRTDHSRKVIRFDEAGLRAWMASRRVR